MEKAHNMYEIQCNANEKSYIVHISTRKTISCHISTTKIIVTNHSIDIKHLFNFNITKIIKTENYTK